MGTIEYRLEILKLTYSHARSEEEAIKRARALEKYLLEESIVDSKSQSPADEVKGEQNSEPSSKDKRPKKKSDNLESLL